jgi:hypothetical protein
MKKYLINGAMALIVGGFIVSCSHDDISQPATVDQMTKSFDEMFTELYGPIAPNHNWGFETIAAEPGEDEATETEAAGTRTTEKDKHRWGKEGGIYADLAEPTPLTDAERADVTNYFARTQFSDEGLSLNWTEYYVEWVSNVSETSAYRNEGDQRGDMGNVSITFDQVSVESTSQWADNGYEKIQDWNASTHPTYYMYETVGTGKFRVWVSYASKWNTKFTVREYKGNYYVGFDIDVTKDSDGRIDLGKKTLGYYNDYIIRLIPGKGQTTPSTPDAKQETTTTETRQFKQIVDLGRVFVEDIATAYMKVTDDIDYNDIVFDARVWRIWNQIDTKVNGKITKTIKETNVKYQYDINLLATGGTIEEKVNGVDVHSKFGVGQAFMVNTWTSFCNQSLSGQWNTPTNLIMPKDFSYWLTYDELPIDPKDDSKRLAGINTIPIELRYNTKEMINLSSKVIGENGKTASAPYKLCLPVGTQWPIERRRIDHAYPKFVDYVSNPNTDFTQDLNVDSLYPAPTSKIQSDFNKGLVKGTTVLVSESSSESTVIVVWEANGNNVSSDGTAITLYNFDFKPGQTLRFFGSGTIQVVGNNNQAIFDSIPMSNGYCDINIKTNGQAANLKGGSIIINGINGSTFSLTKIVVLKK